MIPLVQYSVDYDLDFLFRVTWLPITLLVLAAILTFLFRGTGRT